MSLIPWAWQAGADSTMDACLALFQSTRYSDSNIQESWQARAAFNDGSQPTKPTNVTVGGQSTEWNNDNYVFEHWSSTPLESNGWSIQGYLGADFSNDSGYAPAIQLISGLRNKDTVSITSPLDLHYSGSCSDSIRVFYAALRDSDLTQSRGPWITAPDSGHLLIPADSMNTLPVGAVIELTIVHDKFFSRPDATNRKIGIYSQHETSLYLFTRR